MNLKVLSLAIKAILRNPVNLMLALIPTFISLVIYLGLIVFVSSYFAEISEFIQSYLPTSKLTGWIGKIFSFLFITFVIVVMSWTYILMVGIISTPFNSLLSSRIEASYLLTNLNQDKNTTIKLVLKGYYKTIKNEFWKIVIIITLSFIAVVFNIFPVFYPISIVMFSILMSVQFLDFSWSRHDLNFIDCMKDYGRSFLSYLSSGFVFLILMSIPIINSILLSLGTSYFTILWLYHQKKIQI
jgi:uncharacterized protein involved in cysteine biosynthesis